MKRLPAAPFAAVFVLVSSLVSCVQAPAPDADERRPKAPGPAGAEPAAARSLVAGKAPLEILRLLGARRLEGATDKNIGSYARAFRASDRDRDGKHTRQEYVEQGSFLNPRARQGIFRASDNDGDGVVTRVEYVLNRAITDEAKRIVQGMDADGNGTVDRAEFVAGSKIGDAALGAEVFGALDTSRDGKITVPEYLRVWGKWARPDVEELEAEVAARIEKAGPLSGPPSVEDIFKFMDANKDGKLTKTEYRGPPHVYAAADRDRDGAVTVEEMTAFRARRGGPPKKPGGAKPPGAP